MKKRQNESARAFALRAALSIALVTVSAILLASSFKAAPSQGRTSEKEPQDSEYDWLYSVDCKVLTSRAPTSKPRVWSPADSSV
jgi:hypothetical protein